MIIADNGSGLTYSDKDIFSVGVAKEKLNLNCLSSSMGVSPLLIPPGID